MRPHAKLLSVGCFALSMAATTAVAAAAPEIQRAVAKPQAAGAVHTVRSIPEACMRIEGRFTGQAAPPYAVRVVKTHPQCQPRARWIDSTSAPSAARGWVLNDTIRIPRADCPGQLAVVNVWRRPGSATPPALDAQGRARLYLEEAVKSGPDITTLTAYTAVVSLEGANCTARGAGARR